MLDALAGPRLSVRAEIRATRAAVCAACTCEACMCEACIPIPPEGFAGCQMAAKRRVELFPLWGRRMIWEQLGA